MYPRLFRVLLLMLALLSLPAAAAAQDNLASCKGWERLAVLNEQVREGHFRLREKAEITCDTFKFFADHVDVYTDEERLEASGNVLFTTPDTRISASRVEFNLKTKTGTFYDATGSSKVKPQIGTPAAMSMFGTQEADMHFWGEKLEKLGEKKYRLTNGGFTTCLQPTARWEFTSGSVTINVDRYAVARNTIFRVKGVPLIYLPIIYYPLEEDDRATGFLLPSYGMSNLHGQTIRNAFFWAINRSSDLTLMHDFFSKSGNGYGAEFRYRLSPGSGANVTASLLDEKAHVYTLPNGVEVPRDASRTVQVRGDLTQQLPGNFRAGAIANYTSNITTRQLYESNVANFTDRQSVINANVSGTIAGWQVGGLFDRRETFHATGGSTLAGSAPRVTLSHAEQPIPGLPIYWGVSSEAVGILHEGRTATTVVERNRFRADVRPTVRAPLSKLAWLQATTSLAWRSTWWSESLDASGVPVQEPIRRNYFEMQANFIGPIFNRIFDTPRMGYAQRWKHVIEPGLSLARTTGIDKETVRDRIIPGYDHIDSVVGDTTRVTYGLTNRLYAKRGEGTTGIVREVAALSISQSYYTDPLAAARDEQYRNTFAGESPSNFSPLVFALRAFPVQGSMAEFSADYDTQFNAIRQLRASTTFRVRQNLDVRGGWSQQRLIPGKQGFSDPDNNPHNLDAAATLRTAENRLGTTYQFNYDLLRNGLLNQRLVAYYNAQCCGIGIEYQTSNRPTIGNVQGRVLDRQFNLSFTLAGIGSFSDFFGAFGADPYRR